VLCQLLKKIARCRQKLDGQRGSIGLDVSEDPARNRHEVNDNFLRFPLGVACPPFLPALMLAAGACSKRYPASDFEDRRHS